jgi:hypothetical protein
MFFLSLFRIIHLEAVQSKVDEGKRCVTFRITVTFLAIELFSAIIRTFPPGFQINEEEKTS